MEIEQRRRLVTDVPGPRSRELMERRMRAIPKAVFNTIPLFATAASGSIIEDVDGNRLIDLGAGLAVLNVGNAAPAVVDAVKEQVGKLTHTCQHVALTEPYLELAERLNELVPSRGPVQTMFTNSGAEAVENAVKIARYFTKRPAVVVFDHAFHGRTLMAMSMTAKVMPYKQGFGPMAPEVHRLPFAYPYRCATGGETPEECAERCAAYALDEMDKHIGADNIACVVVEPVQGEGGFIVPGPGFLPRLAEYCADHGIIFVADEVQTGMGRTGRWFGIEHEGVTPDIVATAKSLAGGLPLGAVTARADAMEAVHVGGLGGTFGGNPLSCAAALAVIDTIEKDGLLERAERVGEVMTSRLRDMAERSDAIGEVRGRGAMVAMELVDDRGTKSPAKGLASKVVEECAAQGVVVLKAGTYDNVIRFLPPLTIDEDLLNEGLDVVEKALSQVSP